mmetsp:Transcript_23230/g.22804  ORF Transcript_23230/g.22804 Transcript_23230/m.22804 type:complete len:88 (-) Transcript_23230:65-328(-)
MDRDANGSYGTVQFHYKRGVPLILDSENEYIEQGAEYGLPLTSWGWDTRTFFIVNNGTETSVEVDVTANGALELLSSTIFFLLAFLY